MWPTAWHSHFSGMAGHDLKVCLFRVSTLCFNLLLAEMRSSLCLEIFNEMKLASSQRTFGSCMSWCTRTVVRCGAKWDLETMFPGLGRAWWEIRCVSKGRSAEGSWSVWAVSCRRANLLTFAHEAERHFGRSSRMTEKDLEVKPEWRRRKEGC